MSNNSQLRKTAKHSAIYGFGTMLRRLTGLVMLPIYTRYLTPADYGVVELLSMAIEIVGILIGLRISQAMFRYYILADSIEDKHRIVSTVLFTVIVTSCFGAGLLYFSAEPLSRLIFGTVDYVFEFQLFAFTLVTNAITAAGLSYLRAKQVPLLFVAINIASLIIQVGLNIYFVVMLEMHVTGVVYSALISGIIVSAGLSIYVLSQVGVHYSTAVAMTLIKFVAPLTLASIGAFYVAYADKYFLRLFGNLTDVGLYALAARVSSVLATVFEAFNMSWGADRFEVVKHENANVIYDQVFRLISAFIVICGAGLALFAHDFFRLMTSPDFYSSAYIVPILVLAVIVRMNTIFCNFGAMYMEKTGIIAQSTWLMAIVATIGYLSLIPQFGVYGAATALLLANLTEFVWVNRKSTALYDMGLAWRQVNLMYLVATLIVVTGLLLPYGETQYLVMRILLFTSLLIVIYFMPIWSDEERAMLTSARARLMTRLYRRK